MARIPVADDPRSVRGGKAGKAVLLLFVAAMAWLLPLAVVQSIGGTRGQQRVLDGGEVPAPEIGLLEAAALYAGIPILIMVVVTILVVLPDIVRGPRYRPSRGWSGGATWFAGPPDADQAVRHASAGGRGKGGARGSW